MGKLRCPICRSRQWRKEPSSGMLVCSEGHILQSYRNETTELTEMVSHVLRQRRTGNAKPRAKRQRANPAVYRGTRARFLYFQSLQLLLRLQISALRRLWELPLEFEAICRDVWALHLTTLGEQLHIEPSYGSEAGIPLAENQSPERDEARPSDSEPKDGSDSDQVLYSSDDEKAEVDMEPQNDLADLLDGVSDVSSDDGSRKDELGSIHSGEEVATRRTKAKGNQAASRYAPPSSTIAVLVIACWMIRLPVLYLDFITLINNHALPYLDIVARGLMPHSMVVHMSPALVHSLSTQVPPRPLQLHALSSRIARKLHNVYKIEVPEANAPHILSRMIEALHLPAVFYHMTKIFADMLRISLTLHPSLSAPAVNTSGKSLKIQKGDNIPVEMSLICTAVLLLKLVYGLDGRSRELLSEEDFLPGLPPQKEFLSRLRCDDSLASSLKARTAMELSRTDIDHYLDFCTRALLGNKEQSQDAMLERAFPLPIRNPAADLRPWPASAIGKPNESESLPDFDALESELLPRGKNYTIFCTTDVLGELTDDYRLVVSLAARWCGVENDDIASIVERFERRLLRDLERGPKTTAVDGRE